jgi:hypothetical protein
MTALSSLRVGVYFPRTGITTTSGHSGGGSASTPRAFAHLQAERINYIELCNQEPEPDPI